MPLRKAPLPIAFRGGVSTKEDHKSVPSTQLLNLENATFIKETTLAKRNGYRALGRALDDGTGDVPVCVGMATRADDLLLFDGDRCYSRRWSTDEWGDAGEVSSVVATETPLARTGTQQALPDHATNGGVTVAAWEDSEGGVWISVVEAEGGRLLLAPTQLDSAGERPRCVAVGTVLHVYWARPTINTIYVAVVNPVTPHVVPTPTVLTSDLASATPVYDAGAMGPALYPDILPAVIAWSIQTGGFRVGYVHPSGVLGSPLNGLPSAATYADTAESIAVAYDEHGTSEQIAVAYITNTADTRVRQVSATVPTTSSVASVGAAGGTRAAVAYDDTGCWWAFESIFGGGEDDKNAVTSGKVDYTGAVVVAGRTLRGHCIAASAFYDDGNVYLPLVHAVKFFTYVAIARISADTFGALGTVAVARMLSIQSTGVPPRSHIARVSSVGRIHSVTLGYRIQLDSEDGDQFGEAGIKLAAMDFDHASSYQSAELGRGLYLAGGMLAHYDGRRWAEADFHCAPDFSAAAADPLTQTAAGTIADGTYGYVLVYEEVDAQGELHPGAASVPFLITVSGGGGNGSVEVVIPTYRLTGKKHVRIGVFRSLDGESDTFYRVSGLDPADQSGANCYVMNDPTVDTITFVDGLPDSAVRLREPLYTAGGILSNNPPSISGACIAGNKSRLFWTDPSDPNLIRYSQQLREETALEAPAALALTVDPYGGPVVAIGAMDGSVYPFKRTAVYVFTGPGPLANPQAGQDSFSPAELVTSDVGCKAPNSICQSPVGIVFQSDKGIMLLDRTRNVVSIGDPVYAYNDQTITSATLLPDRHQIVFLTDAGRTLLYDYEKQQWSTYTNHLGYDATVIDNVYHYLRTDGRVFAETPGEYADDNVPIVMKIETAWIKMNGYLQGWQRVVEVLFLGEYKSAHTLLVRWRMDYAPGYSDPIELDVNSNYDPALYGSGSYGSGPYGGSLGYENVYQRKIHLGQRCQSISFRIEDREATGAFGASFELSELLLIGAGIGPKFQVGGARS